MLEKNGPVRAARRYLDNRTDQLGCARAFALDLPGGSGLIESGLRHVHPARFKQATATSAQPASNKPAPRGLKPTLTPLCQLRTLRANLRWDACWTRN